jgi:hypothetical protein
LEPPFEKQVESSARFELSEVIVPAQLAPEVPVSSRVARRLTVPFEKLKRPPADEGAVLPLTVLPITLTVLLASL